MAKEVVKAYYGKAEQHAYFMGCSNGGKMGLMAVQRYPEDFDGVVAGGFVADRTKLMMMFVGYSPGHERDYEAYITGFGSLHGYPSSNFMYMDSFMRWFAFGPSFDSVRQFDYELRGMRVGPPRPPGHPLPPPHVHRLQRALGTRIAGG